MIILEKILGTLKGKEGFAVAGRNFTKIENAINNLDIGGDAGNISYDNTVSEMTAENVQAAIDEIVQKTNNIKTQLGTIETQTILENYLSAHSIPSTAKRGKLDVKLKGMSAVNLVKNGNFENDFTGWSNTGATIDMAKKVSGLKSANVTSNNSLGYIHQNIKGSLGDKYFVRVYCLKNSGNDALAVVLPYGVEVGSIANIISVTDFNSAPTGTWFSKSIVVTSTNNGISILCGRYSAQTFNANFDDVFVVNLTSTFGAGNEPTKEQCDLMFGVYFDGLQGASNITVKSTGKNLFDGNSFEMGTISSTTGNLADSLITCRTSNFIQVTPNTNYFSRVDYIEMRSRVVFFYDETKNFISFKSVNNGTFLTPNNCRYIKHTLTNVAMTNLTQQEFELIKRYAQLEEGTIATAYEPYKVTEATYKTLDGQPITLHRLPNGVKDEITEDGKFVKRVSEHVLKASDITNVINGTNLQRVVIPTTKLANISSQTSNIDSSTFIESLINETLGGNYDVVGYADCWTTDATNLLILKPLSTYANLAAAQAALAGTKIIYELAQPQILDTNATPLIVEFNGHVFITSDGPQPSVELSYTSNIGAVIDGLLEGLKETSKLAGNVITKMPISTTTVGAVGEFKKIQNNDGTSLSLPSGGTWEYQAYWIQTSTGYAAFIGGGGAGIAAGGTLIINAHAGYTPVAFVRRIA